MTILCISGTGCYFNHGAFSNAAGLQMEIWLAVRMTLRHRRSFTSLEMSYPQYAMAGHSGRRTFEWTIH